MKKFKLTKLLVVALVAVMVVGSSALNVFAANDTKKVSATETVENQTLLASTKAKYNFADEVTQAQIDALIKDAVGSLDEITENVEPQKSTCIAFVPSPIKVVKYDGEQHGLDAHVYTTLGGKYVADTTNLYVGVKANGEIYCSFEEPVEVGYYNVVAMYGGSEDYYPIHAYGILVILPACEPDQPVDPEDPVEPEDPEDPVDPGDPVDPDQPGTDDPTVDDPEADDPAEDEPQTDKPVVNEPVVDETEAPKTGDTLSIMTYVLVGVVAIAAIAAVVAGKKRA